MTNTKGNMRVREFIYTDDLVDSTTESGVSFVVFKNRRKEVIVTNYANNL